MFNLFKNIWEYLFAPWKIEIIEEGREPWFHIDETFQKREYARSFVKYKYTHRFRPQVKIVKEYLS